MITKVRNWIIGQEGAPYFLGEENKPGDIEENGTEQENSVGPSKALTATLNGHKSE